MGMWVCMRVHVGMWVHVGKYEGTCGYVDYVGMYEGTCGYVGPGGYMVTYDYIRSQIKLYISVRFISR